MRRRSCRCRCRTEGRSDGKRLVGPRLDLRRVAADLRSSPMSSSPRGSDRLTGYTVAYYERDDMNLEESQNAKFDRRSASSTSSWALTLPSTSAAVGRLPGACGGGSTSSPRRWQQSECACERPAAWTPNRTDRDPMQAGGVRSSLSTANGIGVRDSRPSATCRSSERPNILPSDAGCRCTRSMHT